MISVVILINGEPIMARSAVNIGKDNGHQDACKYKVDDGTFLVHKPHDGVVWLAMEMLKTIKE